jgi:signal transduction histidine kinase
LSVLVQTIAQTLKLPYVAIVNNENGILAATSEKQFTTLHSFPLVYQSQTIGQLLIAPREVGDVFTVEEEKLLRNVARQAGTAVYAGQLTDQLQQSRERLIITREEERRRLRRDLHDGLGPQLAALTIKAGAAQNVLRSDPDKAGKLLTEIKTESQNAIKEIRQVVEGLRPPSLDQLGLLSALQEFVVQNDNGRVQITIQAAEELPNLPAALEVAAYRILTEAITNVMRHAQAQTCQVHLTVNEQLTLTIMDDGIGLPPALPTGVGILSMRERAEELGGTFKVISNEGQTLVTAVLPLPT